MISPLCSVVVLKPTANIELLTTHLALVQESHDADPFSSALAEEDAFSGTKNVYFSPHLVGYAGTFSPELVDKIRQDPMVDFVEKDSIVKTQEVEKGAPWVSRQIAHLLPPTHARLPMRAQTDGLNRPHYETETDADPPSRSCRLSSLRDLRGFRTGTDSRSARSPSTSTTTSPERASMSVSLSRNLPLPPFGHDRPPLPLPLSPAESRLPLLCLCADVVDTGINIEHVEFEGRAKWGKTIPKNDVDKDGNGHGQSEPSLRPLTPCSVADAHLACSLSLLQAPTAPARLRRGSTVSPRRPT